MLIAGVVALAGAVVLTTIVRSRHQAVSAAFWFERVAFDESEPRADRLAGAITEKEIQLIEAIARAEIAKAFSGMRVAVSDRRDATYRVRVAQSLRSAGESRRIAGLGGQGAVSFQVLCIAAIAYAPPEADREAIIAAIGRGVGRAAVHEFAHQLLGTFPIDDSKDRQSYEYASADRREQYYGELHWDIASAELRKRFGMR
jgi:hypothetical protein